MNISKLFVYGLVSVGLAMPPSFSQAQEYYRQTEGFCCGGYRLADLARDIGLLKRTNKLIGTADDLLKAAGYSGALWLITVAADKIGLATRIFKRETVDKIRGLGPAAVILASSAGVFAIAGWGLDLLNRSSANYVAEANNADYYMSNAQAFRAYLNLPEDVQYQIAAEAAAQGKPELAQLVNRLARSVEQADGLAN